MVVFSSPGPAAPAPALTPDQAPETEPAPELSSGSLTGEGDCGIVSWEWSGTSIQNLVLVSGPGRLKFGCPHP